MNAEERLSLLFAELGERTGVRDIAYHRIAEGRLRPVLKTNTDKLGIEKWKSVHAEGPVYVAKDRLLSDIVADPRPVAVQDVKNDPRSAEEFFLFGIDSLLILPVTSPEGVSGIVVVASIGELHYFGEREIGEAAGIVERYKEIFA